LPFKANQDRRHRIPRQKHRVTNWPAYDAGLRARGSLTVWFSAEAIEGWRAEARTGRGGQPKYSNLAIATALVLRAVFRLALRQTEGLIGSILALLGLNLPVPDHSTLSRRADTLEVARPRRGREPVHLLVDSTGLRLCGPGEWLAEKHGTRRRRAWRVLHLATDADTDYVVASVLTDKDADDGSRVGPLARPDRGFGRLLHRRRRLRPGRCLRRSRGAPSRCGRGRTTTRERCAKRSRAVGTDAARHPSPVHRRARPHGLAAGVGVQLARPGRGRRLAVEARHR
jgi:hypothetical protein